MVGGPLEEAAQVLAVCLEGSAAAARQERRRSELRFIAGALEAGLPADYAGMLANLFEVIRNGWDAHVSDGVERVLGRQPRSFEEWAAGLARPSLEGA